MRYFDKTLVANSRLHKKWWDDVSAERRWFSHSEASMAEVMGNAASLDTEWWRDVDTDTKRVMRDDEGDTYMRDLMVFAKPVDIGKLVHLSRVSSDMNDGVTRSLSGQSDVSLDKVTYDYQGTVIPIFDKGYGREWREHATFTSEGYDAIADDNEAATAGLKQDQAKFVLNGDEKIVFQGYKAYGIKTSTRTNAIDMGSGGASIDLTSPSTSEDDIEAFFTQVVGKAMDDNKLTQGINVYVSPEIGRRLDLSYSGSSGFKGGTLRDYLITLRRINKIEVTFELKGNEWFGFVPSAEYIRPLVAMATATTPIPRLKPRDNYQFMVSGAMGIDIRSDFSGHSGVFYASNLT